MRSPVDEHRRLECGGTHVTAGAVRGRGVLAAPSPRRILKRNSDASIPGARCRAGRPCLGGERIAKPAEWGHPHGRFFFFFLNLLVGHGVFLVRPADGTQVVSELTFDGRSGA